MVVGSASTRSWANGVELVADSFYVPHNFTAVSARHELRERGGRLSVGRCEGKFGRCIFPPTRPPRRVDSDRCDEIGSSYASHGTPRGTSSGTTTGVTASLGW